MKGTTAMFWSRLHTLYAQSIPAGSDERRAVNETLESKERSLPNWLVPVDCRFRCTCPPVGGDPVKIVGSHKF